MEKARKIIIGRTKRTLADGRETSGGFIKLR